MPLRKTINQNAQRVVLRLQDAALSTKIAIPTRDTKPGGRLFWIYKGFVLNGVFRVSRRGGSGLGYRPGIDSTMDWFSYSCSLFCKHRGIKGGLGINEDPNIAFMPKALWWLLVGVQGLLTACEIY